jgi:hypothetical protein
MLVENFANTFPDLVMARSTKKPITWVTQLFYFFVAATITVYLLRGFQILSMIPGGVITSLALLAICSGILAILLNLRRNY